MPHRKRKARGQKQSQPPAAVPAATPASIPTTAPINKFAFGISLITLGLGYLVPNVLARFVCVFGGSAIICSHFRPKWFQRRYLAFSMAAIVVAGLSYGASIIYMKFVPKTVRLANVSVEPLQWGGGGVEVSCLNDSNFPAFDERCITSVLVVPFQKGQIPGVLRQVQEDVFTKIVKDLDTRTMTTDMKTLDPHTRRSAIFSANKAPSGFFSEGVFRSLVQEKSTYLIGTVIIWSDDGGHHRKEFCEYVNIDGLVSLYPDGSFNVPLKMCVDHNKQEY